MLGYAVSQVFKCRKSFRHCFSSVLIPRELQSSGKKSYCLTETGLSPELSASNEASSANDMNFTYFLMVSRVILGKQCRAVVVCRVYLFVCRCFLFVSFGFFWGVIFNFKRSVLYVCLPSPFSLAFSLIFITLLSPSL